MKNKGLTVAARDNGNLTARDKAKLTREQNRVSGNSYRKKHNNRTPNIGQ